MNALLRAAISSGCGRIDHVSVVGANLVVQSLGGVGEQVPVLVNRAALDWHALPHRGQCILEPGRAINDEECWSPQSALEEIVEHRAPGCGGFAAHVLDREQHLLAVLAHADDDKQRDRGGLAIEPDANDGAVEDEPYDRLGGESTRAPGGPNAFFLSPDPAHGVLCHGAAGTS